jgi:hypothetical protein
MIEFGPVSGIWRKKTKDVNIRSLGNIKIIRDIRYTEDVSDYLTVSNIDASNTWQHRNKPSVTRTLLLYT